MTRRATSTSDEGGIRALVRGASAMLRRAWTGSRRARALGDDPIGRAGEKEAVRFLRRSGYRILTRNAIVGMGMGLGECDVIALAPDGRTIVLVEVKTRVVDSGEGGDIRPEASITHAKRAKLRAIARTLRRANRWDRRPMRIDSIGVELRNGARPLVRHTPNAVAWE